MNFNTKVFPFSHLDFLAFVLIYASHADYEFTDSEKIKITQVCGEGSFTRASKLFNKMTDFGQLEFIVKNKGTHMASPQEKFELFEQMESQFISDGEYSRPEKALLAFLKRLL